MRAMWKIARIAIPVAASVAALTAVGYAIDWAEVAAIALATPAWAITACVLIVMAELGVAGFRLSILSGAMGAKLSPPAAMSIWSVAHVAGLVLPTSIGNEVVKGGFLLRVSSNPVRVIGVLAIERMAATLALGLLVLVSVPVAAWRLEHPLAMLVSVGCGGVLTMLVLAHVFRVVFLDLARRGARMARLPEKMVDDVAATIARVPFIEAVLLSVIIHLGTVALIAVLLGAVGVNDALAMAMLGGPLVILVSLLPVSVGGFGVREGAFVLVFGMFGAAAPAAASVGLAWWGVQVIAALACCGLAALWFVSRKRAAAGAA